MGDKTPSKDASLPVAAADPPSPEQQPQDDATSPTGSGSVQGFRPRRHSRSHRRSLSGSRNGLAVNVSPVSRAPRRVATPAEFVKKCKGKHVIEKVLIANNGIAAVKCIRSIRRWAYDLFGNERAIQFVVMVTPEDMMANAEYIRMGDQHVDVPGGSNNQNYANVELIVDIALRYGVQAVWAGWGHASENPKLPDLLQSHGILFMGPPGFAMRSLGDKISSSIVAQSAQVPTLPWSGSDLAIQCDGCEGPIKVPDDVYQQGCVKTLPEALAAAARIGYPVMIKASEGGGGKGIRKVVSADNFPSLFRQVQAELPGSPIFIMKLANGARHLEVQVLADDYGNCISLFGRDCSVQRRHQKIIEEAPAAVADPDVFEEMENAAVRLSQLVGYRSAGTVEYLYDVETNTFHFLELNPRLQVEHPCTEMVSGVNLPAAQLQVAMGIPLHYIADIRRLYEVDPEDITPIDFSNPARRPSVLGHTLAARITAENPDEGFKPSSGTVQELTFRSSRDVWGYFSVGASGGLHEYADSQFGHVFAWGEDREQARRAMVLALKELSIRGDFRTTVEYLVKLFETEEFLQNTTSTEWLDHLIATKIHAERPDPMVAVVCGALAIADTEINKRLGEYAHCLSRGQIMPTNHLKQDMPLDLIHEGVKYEVQVTRCGSVLYTLSMNGTFLQVSLHRLSDGGSLVRFNGQSHVTYLKEDVSSYRVTIGGKTCMFEKESDPSVLRTGSTGKLLNFTVPDGAHINEGEDYCEIEVMKMVMPLRATASGNVHHIAVAGSILDQGDIVANLTLDDPTQVKKAIPFTEGFPHPSKVEVDCSGSPHLVFSKVYAEMENIMLGYALPDPYFKPRLESLVDTLFAVCSDWKLPMLQMRDLMSSLQGRLPAEIVNGFEDALAQYERSAKSMLCKFPAQRIADVVDSYLANIQDSQQQNALFMTAQDVFQLVQAYRGGIKGHLMLLVEKLLKAYLDVEGRFSPGRSYEDIVKELRTQFAEEPTKTVEVLYSHNQVDRKNQLVMTLVDRVIEKRLITTDQGTLPGIMLKLAELGHTKHSRVALHVRQALIRLHLPSYDKRKRHMESMFLEATEESFTSTYAPDKLEKIVDSPVAVFDVLAEFLYHQNPTIVQASLEVYVRRAYVAYILESVSHNSTPEKQHFVQFLFSIPHRSAQDPEGLERERTMQSLSRSSSSNSLTSDDGVAPSPTPHSHSLLRVSQSSQGPARITSIDDLVLYGRQAEESLRVGVMVAFDSEAAMEREFGWLLEEAFGSQTASGEPINVLNVAVQLPASLSDKDACAKLADFLLPYRDNMHALQIRRVTFVVIQRQDFPRYFTFRARFGFKEDPIYRHVDPALAYKLEMFRLGQYEITHVPSRTPQTHLYFATAKGKQGEPVTDKRFFVRVVMRTEELVDKETSIHHIHTAGERLLLEALDELEMAFYDPQYGKTDCNHIFINAVAVVCMDPMAYSKKLYDMIMRYGERLWKLRVLEAEIRMNVKLTAKGREIPMRFIISNESGYFLSIHVYKEVIDSKTGVAKYKAYKGVAPLDGRSVMEQYPKKDLTQNKRYMAQSSGTTYAYDFCDLFKVAVTKRWEAVATVNPRIDVPEEPVVCMELVLNDSDELVEAPRPPGRNDVGMVVFRLHMRTPECPSGRDVILIANDVTHLIGSFGEREDQVFLAASQLARRQGIPRIYVGANSGARIGLAKEVMALYRVAWTDPAAPWKGFKYLYLSPDDYRVAKAQKAVEATPIEDEGETRYKLTSIWGVEKSIGVENLRGSGAIAGETSQAYEENFTITLVTGRSVGIGAYLVRLGQRTVQTQHAHIILTGASALNKVLGREVYSSNLQLGGPQIMYENGVSHSIVAHDFEGICDIVHWLSYVPAQRNGPLPETPLLTVGPKHTVFAADPVARPIGFVPTKAPYDPRWMLAGRPHPQNQDEWQSGFFDEGSFTETLAGWAKTVVTGRARLGGIPVGCIAVETRTVEVQIPADPANMDSEALSLSQAGQVWYPDSAYKTAQSIRDFKGEQLPLFIFANWRGFSGGMRDMYDEVLKFGAMIVDALRTYDRPVFVYIPPNCELRGGAWVVVDPTINPDMMEMYADPNCRGGVLEAQGTVEIKYRKPALLETMARLDEVCRTLTAQLKDKDMDRSKRVQLEAKLKERQDLLGPMYHQVSVMFADLHDTASRMKEKGCISDVVDWSDARHFFFWRLKRRLGEQVVLRSLMEAVPDLSVKQATQKIKRWFSGAKGGAQAYLWDDNKVVANWVAQSLKHGKLVPQSEISSTIRLLRQDSVCDSVRRMVNGDHEAAVQSILGLLQDLPAAQRTMVEDALTRLKDSDSDDTTP